MCKKCIEQHQEAMKQANDHMDALGVPKDAIERKVVDITMACRENPALASEMKRCWPDLIALQN